MGEALSIRQDVDLSSCQTLDRSDELVHRGARSYTRHVLNRVAACGVQVGARHRCIDLHHEPKTFNPWQDATDCRCGHIRRAGEHAQFDTAVEAFEVFPHYPSARPDPRTDRGKHDPESRQVSEQRPSGRSGGELATFLASVGEPTTGVSAEADAARVAHHEQRRWFEQVKESLIGRIAVLWTYHQDLLMFQDSIDGAAALGRIDAHAPALGELLVNSACDDLAVSVIGDLASGLADLHRARVTALALLRGAVIGFDRRS